MPVAYAAPLPAPHEGGLKSVAGRAVFSPPAREAMSRVAGGQLPTVFNQQLLGGTAGQVVPLGSDLPFNPPRAADDVIIGNHNLGKPITVAPVAPPVVPIGITALPPQPIGASPPMPTMTQISPTPGVQYAEFYALKDYVESIQRSIGQALESYKSGLSAVASRVDQLSQEVGQAIALSSNASGSLDVLAQNASKALTDISGQVESLNNAVLALARGATSTFTPRSIKVPVATPSIQQMPSTVGNRFPTGVDETLKGNQGTPNARLAYYRR